MLLVSILSNGHTCSLHMWVFYDNSNWFFTLPFPPCFSLDHMWDIRSLTGCETLLAQRQLCSMCVPKAILG